MNKNLLAILISLSTSVVITFLMYSAGVSEELLKVLFAVSTAVNFIAIWLVLEFLIYRDLLTIKEQLLNFLKGTKSNDIPVSNFNLKISKQIHKNLHILQKRKEKKIAFLLKRADFRS